MAHALASDSRWIKIPSVADSLERLLKRKSAEECHFAKRDKSGRSREEDTTNHVINTMPHINAQTSSSMPQISISEVTFEIEEQDEFEIESDSSGSLKDDCPMCRRKPDDGFDHGVPKVQVKNFCRKDKHLENHDQRTGIYPINRRNGLKDLVSSRRNANRPSGMKPLVFSTATTLELLGSDDAKTSSNSLSHVVDGFRRREDSVFCSSDKSTTPAASMNHVRPGSTSSESKGSSGPARLSESTDGGNGRWSKLRFILSRWFKRSSPAAEKVSGPNENKVKASKSPNSPQDGLDGLSMFSPDASSNNSLTAPAKEPGTTPKLSRRSPRRSLSSTRYAAGNPSEIDIVRV